jgi:hypothetical protein
MTGRHPGRGCALPRPAPDAGMCRLEQMYFFRAGLSMTRAAQCPHPGPSSGARERGACLGRGLCDHPGRPAGRKGSAARGLRLPERALPRSRRHRSVRRSHVRGDQAVAGGAPERSAQDPRMHVPPGGVQMLLSGLQQVWPAGQHRSPHRLRPAGQAHRPRAEQRREQHWAPEEHGLLKGRQAPALSGRRSATMVASTPPPKSLNTLRRDVSAPRVRAISSKRWPAIADPSRLNLGAPLRAHSPWTPPRMRLRSRGRG